MIAQFSANSLTLFRGERCLFRDVSFALESGELLILEGANGSGKTSLMKAIVGMLELEEGVFTWKDPKKIARSLKQSADSLNEIRHRFNCL